jgi:hypothetical protein
MEIAHVDSDSFVAANYPHIVDVFVGVVGPLLDALGSLSTASRVEVHHPAVQLL